MAQSFFRITLDDTDVALQLINNPAGISDLEISYNRHEIYGSVMKSIGSTLRFVKEGYDYIKAVYDNKGIDSYCEITIEIINLENKTYDSFYSGVLDFTTYSTDYDFLEIGIIEDNVIAKFIAREDMELNLLDDRNVDGSVITNPSGVQTELSLPSIQPILWAIADGSTSSASGTITTDIIDNPLPINGDLEINLIGTDFDATNKQYTNNTGSSVKVIFPTETKFNIELDLTITSIGVSPPDPSLYFIITLFRLDGGGVVYQYTKEITAVGNQHFSLVDHIETHQLDNNSLPNGDKQGLIAVWSIVFDNCAGSATYSIDIDYTKYDLSYVDGTPAAPILIDMFKPVDSFTSLLEVMGIDTVATPITESGIGNIFLTGGRNIRRFPSTTQINTSFRELFESYSSLMGLGLYYDVNGFDIKPIADFYDSTNKITISKISEVKTSIATDKYFSIIDIGYEKNDYEGINGNIEFCTPFQFSSRNLNTKNKLSKISSIRADSIGIEQLRRNFYFVNGSEEIKGQDDLFFISALLDTGVYRAETGVDFGAITGIRGADQYLNYRITPKRNLINNGFYLNTTLNYLTKYVKYNKSLNNIPLVVDGVEELSWDYDATASRGLEPTYMEFETPYSTELKIYLESWPNNKMTVSYDGSNMEGYLISADINVYKKTAKIKMIFHKN